MKKCGVQDCKLEVFQDRDKCVLHCDKEGYRRDLDNGDLLPQFYEELVSHIVDLIVPEKHDSDEFSRVNLRKYLAGDLEDSLVQRYSESICRKVVFMVGVYFPWRDESGPDNYDYSHVLQMLGKIHFSACAFRYNLLELDRVECFYDTCSFYDRWNPVNTAIIENAQKVLYRDCVFHEDVSLYYGEDERHIIEVSLFHNCVFYKGMFFENVQFVSPIFRDADNGSIISSIFLVNCTLSEKFILNNSEIRKFSSTNTVYESKFEFKSNVVEDFLLDDSNFFELVDTYGTRFSKFRVHKCIFEKFAGFELCEFGDENNNDLSSLAEFKFATFHAFVNLRNTKFYSGLDIENINLKEPPNFLYIELNPTNSNRETYRIIKNSFDSIGNHIEANRFFVYEMKKYKEELKGSKLTQEKALFYINEFVSNFGQSYVRPIGVLILVSFILYLLNLGHENEWLYKMYPPANDYINGISTFVNDLAGNILPFKKFLIKGMEAISLIFYALIGSLIWQMIVAVKRHTKR